MNNNFAENLKRIRKENNISQEQLAEELGVSRQAISKWESSTSYPEMDKIINICNKYNVKIDDLLYGNVKEIKSEEESKRKINNSLNDFLKYITDTINLFANMDFKSKIKCIFEQIIIVGLLSLSGAIVFNLIDDLFEKIIIIFPENLYMYLHPIFESMLLIAIVFLLFSIFTHIFKIRYLDYFNKLKVSCDEEVQEENKINTKNEIAFKQNEKKIIIRDPKHSEYKFISGILKIFVFFIKMFVSLIAMSFCFTLIFIIAMSVVSFLIIKTGLLFIGVFILCLSAGYINYLLLLILLNFIFNRKSNKKYVIITFLISLVFLGISIGIISIGVLDFEIINGDEKYLIEEKNEYDMNNKLFFYEDVPYTIEYIESNIKNIKVEYKKYSYYDVREHVFNNGISYFVDYDNPFKVIKYFLKELNNKKVLITDNIIYEVKIYASKENINILKENSKNAYKNDYE